MPQILDLNPAQLTDKFTSIQTQLEGLTKLPALPDIALDTLPIPNINDITTPVTSFLDILQKLPKNPEELVTDLLAELQQLSSGSLTVGNSLTSLTTLTETTAPLLGDFKTTFDQLNSDLFPTLTQLKNPEINPTYLTQIFPLQTLAQTLPNHLTDVVSPHLTAVSDIQTLLTQLAEDQALAAYQTTLDAIATLPLDSSLTQEHLTILNQTQIDQITTQVNTIRQKAKTAIDKLHPLTQASLSQIDKLHPLTQASLSQDVQSALENTLTAIAPQQLATSSTLFNSILAKKSELKLDSFTPKLQQVVTTIENLVNQNVDKIDQVIETAVQGLEKAIATAEQMLVKVSAIASNLVQQLKTFIHDINNTLSNLLTQVQQVFDQVAAKVNGVLNKVNDITSQLYTTIKSVVEKIAQFDFRPIIEELHKIIYQITAFLEHPQVGKALQTAKQGIETVIKQLDSITLKPVFDQVITEADGVKTKLAAVDVSKLNPMLKTALKTALDPLREAINPEQVAQAIKAEYDQIIEKPLKEDLIKPIKEKFDALTKIVDEFQPGTLIGNQLSKPYEAMVAKLKEFIETDQIVKLLQPITDFQTNVLKQLDEKINPHTLLAPLVELYNQLIGFTKSLSPQMLLQPLNQLLTTASSQLGQLNLEEIINQIINSVRQITTTVSSFRLENQGFWQPIQTILDEGIDKLFNEFVQQIKKGIDCMDLSALQPIMGGLNTAATTIINQINSPELLKLTQTLTDNTQAYAKTYQEQLAKLAQTWQKQTKRITDFTPPQHLKADYQALQKRLQEFNPIRLLAAPTDIIDTIQKTAITLNQQLKQIWEKLKISLQQKRQHLDNLLANQVDGFKTYLQQALDGLVNSPIQEVVQWLGQPLTELKGALKSILNLQQSLHIFDLIPDSMERIKKAILSVKEKVMGFNLNFLTEALQGVMDEVVKPLEILNPEQILIPPLTNIYDNILKTLQSLNPVHLITSARGTVTLKREVTTGILTIPKGTRLIATTPDGAMPFETIADIILAEGANAVDATVQALTPGRGGEVIAVKDVTWRVETQTETLKTLTVIHSEPILSLTTLGRDVILEKLKLLDPVKLIGEPLNEQYQKLVKLKNELGLDKIFDALLKALDKIDQELEEGLKRLAIALKGLLAAMPL